jgi:putative ABC transport system permease protein
VVGLAIAGAVLLRERGVRGASSAGGLTEADPLLAAVPALVGVAAALVVVRVLPYPMRLLAALAATGATSSRSWRCAGRPGTGLADPRGPA